MALLRSWDPLDDKDDDLRELLDHRRDGDFSTLDEGEHRDQEMIARKRDERGLGNPWELPASLTRKPDEDD